MHIHCSPKLAITNATLRCFQRVPRKARIHRHGKFMSQRDMNLLKCYFGYFGEKCVCHLLNSWGSQIRCLCHKCRTYVRAASKNSKKIRNVENICHEVNRAATIIELSTAVVMWLPRDLKQALINQRGKRIKL